MKHIPLKINKLVLSIQIVLFASVTAHAEDNEPYAELETINITAKAQSYLEPEASSATGLNLTTQQTPQSTTVITEEFIEDNNIENVEQLVQETPGVTLQKVDGGKSTYYARGFQIDNYQVDGLNIPREEGFSSGDHLASTAIFEKVEVVRGATGLMTGSGTPSASVNLLRKRADDVAFSGQASASYDEHGGYGTTLELAGGLTNSGKVRGRLIADYKGGETYINLQEQENKTLYGVVDADITDSTTVSLGAKLSETNQKATMWGSLSPYYSDGSKIDYDTSFTAAADWSNWNTEGQEYFGTIEQQITDNLALEVNAQHIETDKENRLLYITDFLKQGVNKQTGAGLFALPGRYNSYHESDSVQAKLTGDFNAFGQWHQFIVGGSYDKYNRQGDSFADYSLGRPLANYYTWNGTGIAQPIWPTKPIEIQNRTIKETGVFAAAQLQLTDPLSVVIGSRLSNYERTDNTTKNGTTTQDNYTKAENIITPYVGATYEFANNQSIYASYTDIFQPQNERDKNGKVLDPITGESFEIGVKGSNADNTLQAQLGVFYTKQDNLAQTTGEFIEGATPPEAAYIGAEGAVSKGVDAEITGMLTPNWQASIGYTHFTAKDANDKTINPYIPDEVIKVATTYDMSNYISGLTVGGGINYTGERYELFTNPATKQKDKYIQKPVLLANLMARYEIDENLSLQLNVDNVFDKKYLNGFNEFEQIHYGEPLTVTGKINYEW